METIMGRMEYVYTCSRRRSLLYTDDARKSRNDAQLISVKMICGWVSPSNKDRVCHGLVQQQQQQHPVDRQNNLIDHRTSILRLVDM